MLGITSPKHRLRAALSHHCYPPLLIILSLLTGFILLLSHLNYRMYSVLSSASPLLTLHTLASNQTSPALPADTPPDTRQSDARRRSLANLPKCAAKGRAPSFLMVFQGHSGSTAIMTSLRKHSQTFITGLEPIDHFAITKETHMNVSRRAVAYTDQFFRNASASAAASAPLSAGFKVRPTHILKLPESFAHVIREHDTRIIWSYRSNTLKQAVGDYRIHKFNDLLSYEGLKTSDNGSALVPDSRNASFRIDDMNLLHSLLKGRAKADNVLAEAVAKISPDNCVLPVSYESLLRDPDLTLLRVHRFLALDESEIQPMERAKANQDALCELVENWDDLCQKLYGCVEWRWMLDDVDNGCSCDSLSVRNLKLDRTFCSFYS